MHRVVTVPLSLTGALAVSLALTAGSADAQTQPCDGQLVFSGGTVSVGTQLAPTLPLSDAARACLTAIGQRVKERPYIRSLTVVVRLPDDQRRANKGLEVAKAMAEVLVAAGAPRRRVSPVAPAVEFGQAEGVQLAYTEMRPGRPVAKLISIYGAALFGRELSSLREAPIQTTLRTYDFLELAPGASGVVQVADGSQLKLAPTARIRFGRVALNSEYKREVEVEVFRGSATTIVKHSEGAPFRLITRAAVAGVRGTTFRTHIEDDGSTRIEVLDGNVELGNEQGSVDVRGGYGSRVAPGQAPEAPRPLLPRAVGHRPLTGTFAAPQPLSWSPVANATGYFVEFARNAEFSKSMSAVQVAEPTVNPDAGLAQGRWFWRVSAVDKDGFIGMPSKIYVFTLDANAQPAALSAEQGAP